MARAFWLSMPNSAGMKRRTPLATAASINEFWTPRAAVARQKTTTWIPVRAVVRDEALPRSTCTTLSFGWEGSLEAESELKRDRTVAEYPALKRAERIRIPRLLVAPARVMRCVAIAMMVCFDDVKWWKS
jgi:hypothetical protein